MLRGTQKINSSGVLEIGGCSSIDLVKKFGTPLYVLDEELIVKNCKEYLNSFSKYYPACGQKGAGFQVIYAGKANMCIGICQLMERERLGLDVSSGGDLYTAISAGFPPELIFMHGNNKTREELEIALKANIGRIVVDNEDELELLNKVAKAQKKKAKILLRLTPGVKPKTHTFIQTGQIDSKFGIQIKNGDALRVVRKIKEFSHVNLMGFHCHIGSQILELNSFKIATEIMMKFIKEVKDQEKIETKELNLGGGLGIRYLKEDKPPKISDYISTITSTVKESCTYYSLPLPKIIVEPGRSIIGEAGTTLYTIGTIKNIPGVRKYVSVDGGMTDNPRPSLYGAKHEAILANRQNKRNVELVTIAGKCCESGDILIWDIRLPKLKLNDILAVFCTGAYNYSMSSNYNRLPRPAMVLVRKGEAKLLVRRETYNDIIEKDIKW